MMQKIKKKRFSHKDRAWAFSPARSNVVKWDGGREGDIKSLLLFDGRASLV
jgi:hypothetical protein